MQENEAKVLLIEIELQAFADRFLGPEAEERLWDVYEAAEACADLNLTRGDPDTWAAAIAYAFARVNFLFDEEDLSDDLTRDAFFDLFETVNRSTVSQTTKAHESRKRRPTDRPDKQLGAGTNQYEFHS